MDLSIGLAKELEAWFGCGAGVVGGRSCVGWRRIAEGFLEDSQREQAFESLPLSPVGARQLSLHSGFWLDHSPQTGAPYTLYRHPLVDRQGLPCIPPPWGTVEALNLQSGKMVWEKPHGTEVAGKQTGSVSLGGVIVTAGGLVFWLELASHFCERMTRRPRGVVEG